MSLLFRIQVIDLSWLRKIEEVIIIGISVYVACFYLEQKEARAKLRNVEVRRWRIINAKSTEFMVITVRMCFLK